MNPLKRRMRDGEFPSPLAGEGLGVRGPRRQARLAARTPHPAHSPSKDGRLSTGYRATFSRKGRRGPLTSV